MPRSGGSDTRSGFDRRAEGAGFFVSLIRGFTEQNTGYDLDGLQLFPSGFATRKPEPLNIERIESVRGPAASLYGGGDPGGFINAISKLPTFTNFGVVEAGLNQYGNAYGAFDICRVAVDRNQWSTRLVSIGRVGGTHPLLALDDGRAAVPLHRMSGSRAAADAPSALLAVGLAAVAIPVAVLFGRSLDILSLGGPLSPRGRGPAGPDPARRDDPFGRDDDRGRPHHRAAHLRRPHRAASRPPPRPAPQRRPASGRGPAGRSRHAAGRLDRAGRDPPFELPSGLTAALIGVPYLLAQLCRRPAR